MIDELELRDCYVPTATKIVMLVVDGLGGLAHPDTGLSELETAHTPNLDAMARESACGLTTPVLPGVAPGSGPGHLALFGYDPLKHQIGRGVLEALGIDIELQPGDVAARGNFCTVDGDGLLVDRRAGRIPTELSAPLCERLDRIKVDGAELRIYPVQDYRFVLHLRGEGLSEQVSETDPQITGAAALPVRALSPEAEKTAALVNGFVDQAGRLLSEEDRANMVLLRGFAQLPHLPPMGDVYRLDPVGIAAYPMYRGLATVSGMRVIPTGHTFGDEVDTLREHYNNHDFFFIHYKPADAAGEDGDFDAKVKRWRSWTRSSLRSAPWSPTCSWLPATTLHPLSWPPIAGTRCLSCFTPGSPRAKGCPASMNGLAAKAPLGVSKPPRSCCWPCPTLEN